MTAGDGFLLVVRWLHGLAALAWVGGSLFYLLVLRPSLRQAGEGSRPANQLTAQTFGSLVDLCVVVLVLSGGVLTFDRLTSRYATVPYGVVLALKVVLALWMFLLARGIGRARRLLLLPDVDTAPQPKGYPLLRAMRGANLVAILGVAVYFLADVLRVLFEAAILSR